MISSHIFNFLSSLLLYNLINKILLNFYSGKSKVKNLKLVVSYKKPLVLQNLTQISFSSIYMRCDFYFLGRGIHITYIIFDLSPKFPNVSNLSTL